MRGGEAAEDEPVAEGVDGAVRLMRPRDDNVTSVGGRPVEPTVQRRWRRRRQLDPATVAAAHAAMLAGDVAALKAALPHDLEAVVDIPNGAPLLACAARFGQYAVAELLLSRGAAVDGATSVGGQTPLALAAQFGQVACGQLLLARGASVDRLDANGLTPLMTALQSCPQSAVGAFIDLLLDADASVHLATQDGITPLYMASHQGHVSCVRQLLAAGANADVASSRGYTPLGVAAHAGHSECLELLLAAGGSVNHSLPQGATALHFAAQRGHAECIQLLLAAGAAIDVQPTDPGDTPLFKAVEKGHVVCVKTLCAGGAAVDLADCEGATPLYLAACNGLTECVALLLDSGANVDQPKTTGDTPLFIAAQNGNEGCLKLLINAGAAVNQCDDVGASPLLMAVRSGTTESVRLLCDAGATPSQAAPNGCTPMQVALLKHNPGLLATLPSSNSWVSPLTPDAAAERLLLVQVLSSHGASRSPSGTGAYSAFSVQQFAADFAADKSVVAWLAHSRTWSPLQHLEALSIGRTRELLRGGADPHSGMPSALERAHGIMASAMTVGTTVRLHSLQGNPTLNDRLGIVLNNRLGTGSKAPGKSGACCIRKFFVRVSRFSC